MLAITARRRNLDPEEGDIFILPSGRIGTSLQGQLKEAVGQGNKLGARRFEAVTRPWPKGLILTRKEFGRNIEFALDQEPGIRCEMTINDQPVESVEQLRRLIREIPAGRTISVGISRNGQPMTVKAQLADRNKMANMDHSFNFVVPPVPPVNIPAVVTNVAERARRTTLKVGNTSVETVEHCMSAFAGLRIDNALVEINGQELPCGDGSASPFVDPILEAGLVEQDAPRRVFRVSEPIVVEVRDGAAERVGSIAAQKETVVVGPVPELDPHRGHDGQAIFHDIGYYMHAGGHGSLPADWDQYLKFMQMHFGTEHK